MSNYLGIKCPICGKPFQEGDDIVVCPICGAPHHRACYQKKGSCAFVDQHSEGFEWKNPNQEAPVQQGMAQEFLPRCPQCGAANTNDQAYCPACGTSLHRREEAQSNSLPPHRIPPLSDESHPHPPSVDPYSTIYGGLSPDETIDGIPAKEVAIYVGPNSQYYLPRFKAVCQGGNTWCWSAFFLNFIYYFYRKMYRVGAMLLAVYVLLSIPSFLWSLEYSRAVLETMGVSLNSAMDTQWIQTIISYSDIASAIRLGFSCFFGLMAVRIYTKHVLASIRKIRSKYTNPEQDSNYLLELSTRGRISQRAVLLTISILLAVEFIGTYVILYWMVA